MLEAKEGLTQQLLGGACSSMLVFSSSIRQWHISVFSLKASISCALRVFVTWLLCASGHWCLSAAEDISDLTSGQVKFCEVPPKLFWDQATYYKTLLYRTLLLSAVLSSSSRAEEFSYSFMSALLAITRAHCYAFVNMKGKLHCREVSSAFAHTKRKKVSVFCACYLEITLAVGSRGLLYLMSSLSENLTIFILFLARFHWQKEQSLGQNNQCFKIFTLPVYFFLFF